MNNNGALIHATRRAHDRYGVRLNENDFTTIHASIRTNRAFYVVKWTSTRKLYFVNHSGITMFGVYSSLAKHMISFLPFSTYYANMFGIKRYYHDSTEWNSLCVARVQEKIREKIQEQQDKGKKVWKLQSVLRGIEYQL